MYRLKLLGGATLAGPSGSVSGPVVQARRIAVLAYLATATERGASRDKLIGLLWPETDEQRGRRHLSQSLYVIRQALGASAIDVTGDVLRLDRSTIIADCTEFDEAIERADLEAAARLYEGPFLDGFFVRDAPAFEEWVDSERRRFAAVYAEALETLASSAQSLNDHGSAARWWEMLSAHDPYNSRPVAGWMRALVALGDPGNAVQVAREHEHRLRRELNLAPAPEVLELLQQLPTSRTPHGVEAPPHAGPTTAMTAVPDDARAVPPPTLVSPPTGHLMRWWPIAVVLLSAFVAWRLWQGRSPPGGVQTVRSVAVLPFMNLTGDPRKDYLAHGIADELISVLSRVPELKVPAQTSSFHFRPGDSDVRAVAESLGVEAILEGSIKGEADRIRVTVQLIDGANGMHRWVDTYDRTLESHLDLQVEIAYATINALGVELPTGWSPVLPSTRDTLAWRLYAKARHWWRLRTQAGFDTAIAYFHRAIDQDSSFVEAWAGLANAMATGAFWGHVPSDDSTRAVAAAAIDRALLLDSTNVGALTALGTRLEDRREIEQAERTYRRAIDLNPNYPIAHLYYADLLVKSGRPELALQEARIADGLDPLSAINKKVLADILLQNLEIEEALEQYTYALHLAPSFTSAGWGRAATLVFLGQFEEAREAIARQVELVGETDATAWLLYLMGNTEESLEVILRAREAGRVDEFDIVAMLYADLGRYDEALAEYRAIAAARPYEPLLEVLPAYIYARSGDYDRAREIVSHLVAMGAEEDAVLEIAGVYAILGDNDRALELLEKAYSDWKGALRFLMVCPWYDGLHDEPRYHDLLERVGLT